MVCGVGVGVGVKEEIEILQKKIFWLDTVANACNPSTSGGQNRHIMRSGVQDQPGQHSETLSLLKIQKLARHNGEHL